MNLLYYNTEQASKNIFMYDWDNFAQKIMRAMLAQSAQTSFCRKTGGSFECVL